MDNIVIVGFMGTGKTVIAKGVAKKCGKKYVSSDECIVKREKMPISEIFSRKGELYFRKVEKEVIKELSGRKDVVIDCGGGVVLDKENMINLRGKGIIICLWADIDSILSRTENDKSRPLLNIPDRRKKIEELLERRKAYYLKADKHVYTSGKTVKEVITEVEEIAGNQ